LEPIILFTLIVLFSSAIGIFLLGLFLTVFTPNVVQERIDRFVSTEQEVNTLPEQSAIPDWFSRFRYGLNNMLSIFTSKDLKLKINSSDWQITAIEYVLIRFFATLLSFGLGWLLVRNVIGGIVLAIGVYLIPGFLLMSNIQGRQRKFQDQLLDILILIRGAIQSGSSLLQSLGVIVSELPAPASVEFGRVQREVQVGFTLNQALQNLANRMESDDLTMVVTAIIINNQVGGNLTVMLTAVTETIRSRIFLLREVRALTSYARYVSYLLSFLPIITALIIYFLNPGYFDGSLESPLTRSIFIAAAIGVVIGNIWLRRIAKIKV
jgi:tight adherence protein B